MKKYLLHLVVVFLFVLLVCQMAVVNARVYDADGEESTIFSDTVWSISQSPIKLNGWVTIKSGVTLTIESGVVIDTAGWRILVYGTLIAKGTNQSMITFTSSFYDESIDMSSYFYLNPILAFSVGSAGALEYTKITKSISIDTDQSITITNSSFEGSIKIYNGASTLAGNHLAELYALGGSARVVNNDIENLDVCSGLPVITGNVIDRMTAAPYGTFQNNTFNGKVIIDESAESYGRVFGLAIPKHTGPTLLENKFMGRVSAIIPCSLYNNSFFDGLDICGDQVSVINNSFIATKNTTLLSIRKSSNADISNNRIVGLNNSPFGITQNGWPVGINVDSRATSVQIVGNSIESCQVGLSLDSSNVTVTKNVITNNYCGIKLVSPVINPATYNQSEVNWSLNSNQSAVIGNDIYGNIGYNLVLATQNDTNVAYNWWGTTDENAIGQSIYDSKNDPRLGMVTFSPIFTAPHDKTPSQANASPFEGNLLTILAVAITAVGCIVLVIVIFLNRQKKVK
ncbi:MAG: right-handed parallel beta-helix repeat-containing protein [Candidatus Bathyarchaeota archaeon]|nr:right-handed parallel beta-helix repeat-containing protein [Candidatus Bathyarchaeota archaeon]